MCVHCRGPSEARACEACLTRLDGQLAEVGELWLELDPVPGGPEGGRRSPGWGSRSPARDDVICLTDWRSDVSVARALAQACRFPALRANLRAPGTVPGMITLLRLAWVLDLLSAADAAAVDTTLAHLRAATNRAERTVPVGPCPVEIPDPDGAEPIRCAAPLRAPLHGPRITCPECGTRWERDQWPALAAASPVLNAA